MIPTLSEHRNVNDYAGLAHRVIGKDGLAGLSRQIAVDQRGRDPRAAECLGHMVRVGDGGTEDDRLPVACLLAPVADHLVGDRRAVHDVRHLGHVEIRTGLADRLQFLLHADIDDEGTRRHEVA